MPRGRKHYRIKPEDAFKAHDTASTHEGTPGVINLHLIESAIARPYNGYYRRILKKATSLFESICRNHGFTDGNKRTAVLLSELLIERSGYELVSDDNEDLDNAIEDLAVNVANGLRGKNLEKLLMFIQVAFFGFDSIIQLLSYPVQEGRLHFFILYNSGKIKCDINEYQYCLVPEKDE